MKHSARVLACRSAPLAAAYCDQLHDAYADVAAAIRRGERVLALAGFEHALEPLQKLLVFTAVAGDLLRDAQHPLRGPVEGFMRAVLRILDPLEEAVVSQDFEQIVALLELELVPTLEQFHELGGRLAAALEPRLAA